MKLTASERSLAQAHSYLPPVRIRAKWPYPCLTIYKGFACPNYDETGRCLRRASVAVVEIDFVPDGCPNVNRPKTPDWGDGAKQENLFG
jgi:hypothetical protein